MEICYQPHKIKIQVRHSYIYAQIDGTITLFQQPSIDISLAFRCFSYENTSSKL